MERNWKFYLGISLIVLFIIILIGIATFSYTPPNYSTSSVNSNNSTGSANSNNSGSNKSVKRQTGGAGPVKRPSLKTQSNWSCKTAPNGFTNIIERNSNGVIQCLGPGGPHCYWYPSLSGCKSNIGADKAYSGSSPYVCTSQNWNNPKHWCYNKRTDV